MIWSFLSWYLLVTALGLLVFPLAYRLLPGLNDRGYAVSRTMGLLLWGFSFWILSSYGLLANTTGGYLLALILLLALVYWALKKHPLEEIFAWIKEHKRNLITVEVLFLVAFVFMAWMRAMEPELIGTEKPMELAFINAILRSPSMPPHDPWLAGYSISYYYFGYVIVAMLARITGVSAGVAFNLGISLVFALTAVGAYGMVYNLLATFQPEKRISRAFMALFGPLFVLLVSNAEGFLEYLRMKGLFWTQTADGAWQSKFWEWLNIIDLNVPPSAAERAGDLRYLWWWRASRVVYDSSITGAHQEVIDEFPFFSYYLADLHPHVLAMPFIFLAMSLGLNVFLNHQPVEKPFWVWTLKIDWSFEPFLSIQRTPFDFSAPEFALTAVMLGGLAFLNIWDWPWYVGLFAAGYVLRRAQQHGWAWGRLWEFIGLGLLLGLAGGLAYLPYYLGFSSQAGGVLPNVINPTRGAHLWVMFGTLIVPIFAFLGYLLVRKRDVHSLWAGFSWTLSGVLLLFASSVIPVVILAKVYQNTGIPADSFLASFGGLSYQEVLQTDFARRAAAIFGLLTLVALVGMALAALWPKSHASGEEPSTPLPNSHMFAAVLVLLGGLLVILPEFIFLNDLFGTRMNTIFKFYYQAWLLWSVAAAYGSAVLLGSRKARGALYGLLLAVVLGIGLIYSFTGINYRLSGFEQRADHQLTLDGVSGSYYFTPDEKLAVRWLQQAPLGTLVEAVGGSYSGAARISTNSGQPALLGWPWHETQWRGSGEAAGSREYDIQRLYVTNSWQEADQIIQRYGIVYIVVGNLERSTYPVQDDKFNRYLSVVFQSGAVTIYQTSITSP